MNRKKWLYLAVGLLLTLSLLVPGCAREVEEPEVGVLKVGIALCTTGPGAKVGREIRDGLLLAIKLFNDKGGVTVGGKQYHIMPIEYSTGTSPEEGLSVTKRLIELDKVTVLIGDCLSSVALVQQPFVEAAKIPWIMFGAHPGLINEDNRYTFRMNDDAGLVYLDTVRYYRDKRGITKWSMLSATDATNKMIYDTILGASKELGVEIVTADTFELGAVDFYPVLTKIAAAKPQGVIVLALAEPATILKQAHEIGYEPGLWHLNNQVSSFELAKMVGDLVVGVEQVNAFDPAMDKPAVVEFVTALEEFLSRGRAYLTTAMGYEAGMRMFMAIEYANSLDADEIVAALHEVEWAGALATGSFDELGRVKLAYHIMEIQADGSLKMGDVIPRTK